MSPRAHLFRFMQGLVTFYKPPNIDAMKFRRKIADKVARGLITFFSNYHSLRI